MLVVLQPEGTKIECPLTRCVHTVTDDSVVYDHNVIHVTQKIYDKLKEKSREA